MRSLFAACCAGALACAPPKDARDEAIVHDAGLDAGPIDAAVANTAYDASCPKSAKSPTLDVYFANVTTPDDARQHFVIRIPPQLPSYEVIDEVELALPGNSARACTTTIESSSPDTMTFQCSGGPAISDIAVGAVSLHGDLVTIQLHRGSIAPITRGDAFDDTRTIAVPCGTHLRFHVP